jgi:predicted nucleic acid-binding protein
MSAAPLVCVDTNVLIYARDAREPAKQRRAQAWMQYLWDEQCGRVSAQVLHEYYVCVTQKLKPGLSREEARADVRALAQWLTPQDPMPLMEEAWQLQDESSLSWWDALVLAGASAASCRYFLTEDMQAGQELAGIHIVNPFVNEPGKF